MTRSFSDIEQLTKYMVSHLYTLYDEAENLNSSEYIFTFLEGSIETTQHYLTKSGIDFLEYDEYNKTIQSARVIERA